MNVVLCLYLFWRKRKHAKEQHESNATVLAECGRNYFYTNQNNHEREENRTYYRRPKSENVYVLKGGNPNTMICNPKEATKVEQISEMQNDRELQANQRPESTSNQSNIIQVTAEIHPQPGPSTDVFGSESRISRLNIDDSSESDNNDLAKIDTAYAIASKTTTDIDKKSKKILDTSNWICVMPNCLAHYTRKYKLNNHLKKKHGLDIEEQQKFYQEFSADTRKLSHEKRGPKAYIPSRFRCPTEKYSASYSRKDKLIDHLKKCNDQKLQDTDIQCLKDVRMQYCKCCKQILKSGHLARHKTSCLAKRGRISYKIKFPRFNKKKNSTKPTTKTKTTKHHSSENDLACNEATSGLNIKKEVHPTEIHQCNVSCRRGEVDQIQAAVDNQIYPDLDQLQNIMSLQDKLDYLKEDKQLEEEDLMKPFKLGRKTCAANHHINYNNNRECFSENQYIKAPLARAETVLPQKVSKNELIKEKPLCIPSCSSLAAPVNIPSNSKVGPAVHTAQRKDMTQDFGNTHADLCQSEADKIAVSAHSSIGGRYNLRNRVKPIKIQQENKTDLDHVSPSSGSEMSEDISFDDSASYYSQTQLSYSSSSSYDTVGPMDLIKIAKPSPLKKTNDVTSIKNQGHSQIIRAKKGDKFNPFSFPEFLNLHNDDVLPVFKRKEFEEWNKSFKAYFHKLDNSAGRSSNDKTIQQYISEIC